jgi:phosphoribosylformimino-5-aminoimidazole carboxamide ribotide isomerase
MIIIPAIDIRNGKCVRLTQGNYSNEIIYGDDPVDMALKWQTEGARALHIVDLDGARSGQLTNFKIIEKITRIVKVPVQIGGGIQSAEAIQKLLSIGVSKVIIGTLALGDEVLLKKLLSSYADQIIVSLDSKNGLLAKRGWLESTDNNLITTAQKLEKLGVKSFIYTDVLKDGTLTQPNYEGIQELLNAIDVPLIAAGGISSIADIEQLKGMKVAGVIIGKALYEVRINIKEANNVS